MAKQNPPEPRLTVDRRQLLTTAAAVTVAGVLPTDPIEAATPADVAIAPAPIPVAHPPPLNLCAATARRIEKIVARNRIRQEAQLPLLCIPGELRRMKTAEDLAEFERFAAHHMEAIWEQVLAPVREAKGDPHWWPRGFMEGMGYQAQVSKVLRERFAAQQPARCASYSRRFFEVFDHALLGMMAGPRSIDGAAWPSEHQSAF